MLDTLRYILRLLWFILRITVVVVLVISLSFVTFLVARDSANVYVIVTDGMKARASVMLEKEDSGELFKYFTNTYMASDDSIHSDTYAGFLIRSFDYDIKIESLWCRPWDGVADVVIVESIPTIDGEKPATEEDADPEKPPLWPRRRYAITCVQQESAWLIDSLRIIESLPPAATPTKEPEITPTPEGMTPSPAPTLEPTPSN